MQRVVHRNRLTAEQVEKRDRVKRLIEQEGTKYEFEHCGYLCLLLRGYSHAWCGYVIIDSYHPLYGLDYAHLDARKLNVHGGLTYSNHAKWLIELPAKKPQRDGWVGVRVRLYARVRLFTLLPYPTLQRGTYRTKEYVIDQCKKLAEQLHKVELSSRDEK